MNRCKSSECGARIEWAKSATTGKPIPLDAEPTENGNLALVDGVARRYNTDDAIAGRPRRTSHFATCPAAAEHRSAR